MKQIIIKSKKYGIKSVLVDDDNYEYLNQWKWFFNPKGYAERALNIDGKKVQVGMHRLVNKTPTGLITDHINGNGLDNRKENLRTVNDYQSTMNRGMQKNNTSGYPGIYWRESNKKWIVCIKSNKKRVHLGYYSSFSGAWLARRWGERIYHGDYSRNLLQFLKKKLGI